MKEQRSIKRNILIEAQGNIKKGNIKTAKLLLKGYLAYENKDAEVSSILAKIYEQEGNLEEALAILENQNYRQFCVFEELIKVYIKLQRYDDVYKLWKKHEDLTFLDIKKRYQHKKVRVYLRRTQILLKNLGKDVKAPPNLTYKECQYLNYDYIKTIKHVEARHSNTDDKPGKNNTSIFYQRYDLENLIVSAARSLEFEKRELKLDWTYSDTYIFKYNDIGCSNNGTNLNYFRVATIPNTNKIITMYPVFKRVSSTPCYLNEKDSIAIYSTSVHSDKTYRFRKFPN